MNVQSSSTQGQEAPKTNENRVNAYWIMVGCGVVNALVLVSLLGWDKSTSGGVWEILVWEILLVSLAGGMMTAVVSAFSIEKCWMSLSFANASFWIATLTAIISGRQFVIALASVLIGTVVVIARLYSATKGDVID